MRVAFTLGRDRAGPSCARSGVLDGFIVGVPQREDVVSRTEPVRDFGGMLGKEGDEGVKVVIEDTAFSAKLK